MKRFIHILLLMALFNTNKAQLLFYQDTYRGGVTADGVAYIDFNNLQADTINFQLHIPNTSSVKKAFLFTRRYDLIVPPISHKDAPLPIKFNNIGLTIDSTNIVTPVFYDVDGAAAWICSIDVTNYMQHTGNTLIIPNQTVLMLSDPLRSLAYTGYYLVVLYKDNTMQITNSAIVLNNQYETTNNTYNIGSLNPINTINDVGLSFWCDYACSINFPGSQVQYNLQSTTGTYTLGSLDEKNGSNCSNNLPGNFYYDNNTLVGLGNNINNPFIDSTDAIANIKSYLANNAISFNLTASTQIVDGGTDMRNGYVLAYNSPCPARSNKDTTLSYIPICSGDNIQLNNNPSVGSYTWNASNNSLNNYNIPNPIANPTVTTTYIALIDSNGCKHTEHFKVSVYTTPKTDSVTTTVGICGGAHGTATIVCNVGSPTSYTVNGTLQSSPTFNNLAAGTYTFAISNNHSCSYTSPNFFVIKDTNLAKAFFYTTPTSGCEPLTISCTNLSNNQGNFTNSYAWYVSNDSATTANFNYTFTDTGKYTITLLAYETLRSCSATFTQTITVKSCPPDSFSITIPNIFTPNGDDINETWQVSVSNYQFTVNNYSCVIYDRWGVKVFETNNIAEGWSGRSTSGIACSAGSYFYVLGYKATGSGGEVKENKLKGFIELVM